MPFDARLFRLAKEAEHPELNQDACRLDVQRGVAVIADGATSGIFSRRWANILSDRVVAGLPDVDDPTAFSTWLIECRSEWESTIDTTSLAWHQKAKLRDGAFATLLWVDVFPVSECEVQPAEPTSDWFVTARAIGDSCMLLARDGRQEASFPIQSSEELQVDPILLGSLDLNHDDRMAFSLLETECRSGDLIILCTDAVADWALRRQEAGDPVDWEAYWGMSRQAWMQEVLQLREQGQFRYDDSTLLLLRVGQDAVEPDNADVLLDLASHTEIDGLVDDQVVDSSPAETPRERADWREQLDNVKEKADELTGKVADVLSEQFDRGVGKLQDALGGAEKALKNYRQKRQKEKPSDEDDTRS